MRNIQMGLEAILALGVWLGMGHTLCVVQVSVLS